MKTSFIGAVACVGVAVADDQAQSFSIAVLGDDPKIRICMERALEEAIVHADAPIVLAPTSDPNDDIRKAFFPWLEADDRDEIEGSLTFLRENPLAIRQRKATGLRYLVLTSGQTTLGEYHGFMECYTGCLGYAWRQRESTIHATIWDLDNPTGLTELVSEKAGKDAMPALLVPIPIWASTQILACKEIAEGITTQISDSN